MHNTPTLTDSLAAKLRGAAAERKCTGAALADALGTSPLWVSRRLTGTVPLSVPDLARICDVLNVDPVEVFASALPAERAAAS